MGIQDLPPSINILEMIKHFFDGRKRNSNGKYEGDKPRYKLVGSAFNDERLTRLYMSYKNATDYVQPWNYGKHAQISIQGVWSSTHNKRTNASGRQYEKGVNQGFNDGYTAYGCDLLNATNSKIQILQDTGGNVFYKEVNDSNDPYGRTWAQCQIRIPVAGFYKVRLVAGLKILNAEEWRDTDKYTGVQHVCCHTENANNDMRNKMYEFRLLRDWGKGDFGLANPKLNGTFYYNNLPQNARFEGNSNFDPSTDVPKYFPQIISNDRGQQLFIDAAQDRNIVGGFAFGARGTGEYKNPLDSSTTLAQIQIAKPAQSWDVSIEELTRLAVDNPGYSKYGHIDSHNPDGDVPDEDDTIVWRNSDRFKIELDGIPEGERNHAFRGFYWSDEDSPELSGNGRISAVVWFEAGELVTLASISEEGRYRRNGMHSVYGWTEHEITFNLSIQPFRTNADWLKVDTSGNGTAVMKWNDPVNFDVDSINLVGFLPADMKTDDFIDNFCKAYNLQLTQIDANTFELNVKQSKTAVSSLFINLDNLASVKDRSNTPLGLPSLYKLGFIIDQEEEGYVESIDPQTGKGDDGGGEFETGATEEKVVEQKSNFSFNWFKNITYTVGGGKIVLPLAVISKHEPWENTVSYPDAMKKRYPNQALRFWYPDGLLNDLGATFNFNGKPLSITKVSNELPGLSILSYKNQRLTILDNYFTLLINGSSHYTEVEGYLTPDQYEDLNGSIMAMFNSDLYYVAEISGYDPTGRNKTKIKLIRKI